MDQLNICDIILCNAMILTMDSKMTYYQDGYVAVTDDKIVALGEGPAPFTAHKVIDARGCVVMPGFVNTHSHMGMGYLRGFADDIALYEFLDKTFPIVIASGTQDTYDFIKLAAAEMIRSGYVATAEMIGKLPHSIQAFLDSGLRCLIGPGGVDFNDESKVEGIIQDNADAFYKYNGAGHGRIKVGFTIHAPYDSSGLLIRRTAEAASELKTDVQIHLSENCEEVREIRERFNMTPTEYVNSLGLFGPNVLAAHYVQVTSEDMDMAKDAGIRVSHNIGSNLKLASGIAPVHEMLRRGIPVGLGTDSNVTNNRLDAFDTMKTTALVAKGHYGDATILPAYTVLSMATSMGAKAIGMDEKIGSIELGKCADLIMVRFEGVSHLTPYYPRSMNNIVSNLVYAAYAEDVDTVIINGNVVMENRTILAFDEEEAIRNAQKDADDLLARSGNI